MVVFDDRVVPPLLEPKLVSVVARATESYRNKRKRKTSTWTHGHMDTVLEGLFRGVPKWWKECNVCYTFHFGPFISAINKTICDNNRVGFSYTGGQFYARLWGGR